MSIRVATYLKRNLRWSALHFTLIDPANVAPDRAARGAKEAEDAGSHAILVGGSTGATSALVEDAVKAIKRVVSIPVILFPGGAEGVTSEADAILFMMMINSEDPRFLVGEQLRAVSSVEAAGIETISMGYIVVEPGGQVGRVGRARLVARDDMEGAVRYALLAKYYGMDFVYLEAGSGAPEPVPAEMIRVVRRRSGLPTIVGGGIRDAAAARRVIEAGADIFVTGNVLEGEVDVHKALASILRDSVDELKRRLGHSRWRR